jgi:chondroitin 4-sulfotransferase 11
MMSIKYDKSLQHILRVRIADLRGRGVYSGYPDQFKCIFIHIPKTAGTSIARTLFNIYSRHVPYFEYEKANPRKFARYFKFAFVRNPWDRLLSAYLFLKKGGMNDADRTWTAKNLSQFENFEQFVLEWVTEENVWSWVHFMPQHYFICDSSGSIKMDFVGRMENLITDFTFVAHSIGSHAELSLLNKTREDHYSRYYTNEMRAVVARVYMKDIDILNYAFDQSKADQTETEKFREKPQYFVPYDK